MATEKQTEWRKDEASDTLSLSGFLIEGRPQQLLFRESSWMHLCELKHDEVLHILSNEQDVMYITSPL